MPPIFTFRLDPRSGDQRTSASLSQNRLATVFRANNTGQFGNNKQKTNMKTKEEIALLRKKYLNQISVVICNSYLDYFSFSEKKYKKVTQKTKKYNKLNRKKSFPKLEQMELFVSVDQYVDVNVYGKEAIDDLNCENSMASDTEINKGKSTEQSISLVSPIMTEEPIINLRRFENIVSWSPYQIQLKDIIEDEYLTPEELRLWLSKDDLYNLLYKDQMDDQSCNDFFTEAEGKRFVKEFLGTDKGQEYLTYKWRKAIRAINNELHFRIGIFRLGKNKLSSSPRVWIGRSSSAGSSRVLVKAFDKERDSIAEKIITAFVGKDASDKVWDFCYRGGTWKIIIYEKPTLNKVSPRISNTFYIEEFESEDLL